MPSQLIEGPIAAIDRTDGFDEGGYPQQHSKVRIADTVFTFSVRQFHPLNPDEGEYLIAELDPSGQRAVRCYAPYRDIGMGRGWKQLRKRPSALEHRFKVIHGQVQHKEINHVRADLTREGSLPSHYYRVVLTNGETFLLDEQLGGHVRSGDDVQVLWHGAQGLIAYRNLTRPKRSGPRWTDWLIVIGFSIPLVWMFVHFLQLMTEPDGFKVFFLVLIGCLPVFWAASLIRRHVRSQRMLALLEERMQEESGNDRARRKG